MAGRARVLLPGVLALGAMVLLASTVSESFVSAPGSNKKNTKALRAFFGQQTEEKKEEGGFKMPKPDTRILNEQAAVGRSVDQDRRGNMWSVEPEMKYNVNEEEALPAVIYFPVVIALTIGSIFFFAKLTSEDPRFGGQLGDDARLINEWG
mmetsp:Transcript_23294/g.41220  ORF Transcript_23294/g.41220 Transcript_23294/m.41220 type:complete len:151 (+) Transcript_23294:61-513(+)